MTEIHNKLLDTPNILEAYDKTIEEYLVFILDTMGNFLPDDNGLVSILVHEFREGFEDPSYTYSVNFIWMPFNPMEKGTVDRIYNRRVDSRLSQRLSGLYTKFFNQRE